MFPSSNCKRYDSDDGDDGDDDDDDDDDDNDVVWYRF